MVCFEISSLAIEKVVRRVMVCHHTNRTFTRRTFHLGIRLRNSSILFRRKTCSLNFTNPRMEWKRIRPPITAEYAKWPFEREDYKRVKIHLVKMLSHSPASGTMLLIEDKFKDEVVDSDPRGLMIQVGGDSLVGITYSATGKEPERPMTLHLLNKILERFEELNPVEWQLLHVAVVDIRNNTFIGRLFFGNQKTGKVIWDCDCRPSDACWLALKKERPIYIRNSVWQTCAQSLQKMFTEQSEIRSSLENLSWITPEEAASRLKAEGDPFTSIIATDPVIIKRLKREMSVAVTEEDYSTAARIRDHPYMKLYKSMIDLRNAGKHEEASQMEQDLLDRISQDHFDD